MVDDPAVDWQGGEGSGADSEGSVLGCAGVVDGCVGRIARSSVVVGVRAKSLRSLLSPETLAFGDRSCSLRGASSVGRKHANHSFAPYLRV